MSRQRRRAGTRSSAPEPSAKGKEREERGRPAATGGIDRTNVRIGIVAVLVLVAFGGLFSRLWFLQVLASEDYRVLGERNRVRYARSEAPRGRILDRSGKVLVGNRMSLAITVDREIVDETREVRRTVQKLSKLLRVDPTDLKNNLYDPAASPYQPVPVAYDVAERAVYRIGENKEDFPGVSWDLLPVRTYPQGKAAAHILGYVGEISPEQLEEDRFRNARPRYRAGDTVGKTGIELSYDRFLRGRPRVEKVIVNASGERIKSTVMQRERPGADLVLSLDLRIQRLAEKALRSGIDAARGAGYNAPGGAVTVLDPRDGSVIAMASLPTYDPSILADGITVKEFARLGQATPENTDDDKLLNRAVQGQRPPGSTFKVITAGAAMASGVATPYSTLECPGAFRYRDVVFHNWTSAHSGFIGFPESLERSCDTFYYALGARLESFGDKEPLQRYARRAGFGHPTGIDLPYEAEGRVPDRQWCAAVYRQTKNTDYPLCADGWLPGYTVNMAIGQGDLIVTPLQMATTYGAIANGGKVWEPRIGMRLSQELESGNHEVLREFPSEVRSRLPLDQSELSVIKQGLVDVISGANGTAAGAFSGFPLHRAPLAGKTGTAELSETNEGLNDAWFVSYGPSASSPDYVISVYVEEAGHGGESAAPIARQIWEGIVQGDKNTEVDLGRDFSG